MDWERLERSETIAEWLLVGLMVIGIVVLLGVVAKATLDAAHDNRARPLPSDTISMRADMPRGYNLQACIADLERLQQQTGMTAWQVRGADASPDK